MGKFQDFVLIKEAGESLERQEVGFVNLVMSGVRKNKGQPITVSTNHGASIKNVISAQKFGGRTSGGSEPLTDVILKVKGGKDVRLSMKGLSAPSLAGGGLKGIEAIIPGLSNRFMTAAHAALSKKHKSGDKIPDIYAKMNDSDKIKLLKGNEAAGGPIDFMYIGNMDVEGQVTGTSVVISNGRMIDVNKYAKEHDLFFRLRARREDQTFDPKSKFGDGTPKVYGKSPSKGDSAGRIVVTSSTPKGAFIISL